MDSIKEFLKYYIGCEVLVDDNERGILIGADLIPNSAGQIYYNIQTDEMRLNEGQDFCIPFNDDLTDRSRIKPILRKLSSITEEEAIDIYTLERDNALHHPTDDHDVRKTPNGFIVVRLDLIDVHIHIGYEAQIWKTIQPIGKKPFFEQVNNWPAIFHYLLSKGFWLWHPEAFDKGLIIEKQG